MTSVKSDKNHSQKPGCSLPENLQGTDVTEYARGIGYTGIKAVVVQDGRVISHRGMDWARFCQKARMGRL